MDDSQVQATMELLARGWFEDRQNAIAVAFGEAEKFAIDYDVLDRAIGFSPSEDAIFELSRILSKAADEREQAELAGEVHLSTKPEIMGEALLNFLATALLRNCAALNIPPPSDLIDVFEKQLKTNSFGKKQKDSVKPQLVALFLLTQNPDTSAADIARKLGVDRSTVSRWFKDEEFQSDLDNMRNDPKLMAAIPQILENLKK